MTTPSADVVLYSRTTCPLCDDARDIVARVCREAGVEWIEHVIDDSPQLIATFGDYVPVVEVAGVQQGFWHINEPRLVRAIAELRP